jgi:alcohol dehydrogenase
MYLPDNYEFSCPMKINSGTKALEHLPFELDVLNARKPFIITNKDSADHERVNIIIDAFKDSGVTIGIFDAVPSSPDVRLIRDLYSIYRDRGYDAIIVLGGGAVTDTAKALNIVVSGEPEDIERCAGDNLIPKHLKPFIMVPTLSGTGYETTRYAFFGGKTYASHFLMPDLVVIDPRMTIAEDVMTTAASTLVALTHSVEAYVSVVKNPLADSYAFPAIRFIMENLANVIRNPSDKKGRLALANAHCLAGCAFSNTEMGITHKLGKVIGNSSHVPHGICVAILLPHVLESRLSKGGAHIDDLLLPLAGFDVYAGTPDEMRSQKAIDVLYDFQRELSVASGGAIASSLMDAGVSKEILEDVRKRAIGNGSESVDGYQKILEQAWKGK